MAESLILRTPTRHGGTAPSTRMTPSSTRSGRLRNDLSNSPSASVIMARKAKEAAAAMAAAEEIPIDPELLALEANGVARSQEDDDDMRDAEGELDYNDEWQSQPNGGTSSQRAGSHLSGEVLGEVLGEPSRPSPIPSSTSAKNRLRPAKSSTPLTNGHTASSIAGPSKPAPAPPATKAKSKGAAKGKVNGKAVPDEWCSFCLGSEERNRQQVPEKMLGCSKCGRSGHLSCLNMYDEKMIRKVSTYDWLCLECKSCGVCQSKGDEAKLLFCDGCDRGFHCYCLDPPFANPPSGRWICHLCRASPSFESRPRPASTNKIHPPPQTQSTSRKAKQPLVHPPPIYDTPTARNRKQARSATVLSFDGEGEVLGETRPKIKLSARPRPSAVTLNGSAIKDRKGKGKASRQDDDDDFVSPGLVVKLRVPSGTRKQTVEVESEEEKVPYGGVITGDDADQSKTTITEKDKADFAKALEAAEAKLGGPPPPAWDPIAYTTSLQGSPAPSVILGTPAPPSISGNHTTPAPPRTLRNQLLTNAIGNGTPNGLDSPGSSTPLRVPNLVASASQKIKSIRFGEFDIDTWYSAPYPEEYQHVPGGRLWLCEFCLKYMKSGFVAGRHRLKCKIRHPPGDEIYRDGTVSVFEVDGRKNKIYCQNLCLLAKMFLDHKTLYYDVEPFLFYVMTEVDELGARFVGYFSKEKRSPDNNVSCIMTLPVRQRKGWGQLLIDFSYLLSKKEGRVGSPEKPLSGLGEVTYHKYWTLTVFNYLRTATPDVKMDDISQATSMTLDDIYWVLRNETMIDVHDSPPRELSASVSRNKNRNRGRARPGLSRRKASEPASSADKDDKPPIPTRYRIVWDQDYVEAILRTHRSKGHLTLKPEKLKYHPFLVTRNAKPPGTIAAAALTAGGTAVDKPVHGLATATPAAAPANANATSARDSLGADDFSTDGEVLDMPVDDLASAQSAQSTLGTVDKIAAGKDEETLALVAQLAEQDEGKRRQLRKRPSGTGSPDSLVRNTRQKTQPSPRNGMRRSLRGMPAPALPAAVDVPESLPIPTPVPVPVPMDVDVTVTIDDSPKSVRTSSRRSSRILAAADLPPAAPAPASLPLTPPLFQGQAQDQVEQQEEWGDEDAEGEDEYVD